MKTLKLWKSLYKTSLNYFKSYNDVKKNLFKKKTKWDILQNSCAIIIHSLKCIIKITKQKAHAYKIAFSKIQPNLRKLITLLFNTIQKKIILSLRIYFPHFLPIISTFISNSKRAKYSPHHTHIFTYNVCGDGETIIDYSYQKVASGNPESIIL